MTWAVRKVKEFRGSEGYGYNAELLRDGKPVAFVIDEGDGGEAYFEWADRKEPHVDINTFVTDYDKNDGSEKAHSYRGTPEEKLLVEWGNAQIFEEQGTRLRKDAGWVVSELIEERNEEKQFKRWCKTKTVFRLIGDEKDEWRTIKAIYSPKVKAFIVDKYGDKVASILNERY